MRAALSTLNWMTFAPDDPSAPPYGAAPVPRLLDAARAAGFGAVGFDLVTLGGPDGEAGSLTSLTVSDIGVLRIGEPATTAAAAALGRAARRLRAPLCSAILVAPPSAAVVASLAAVSELSGCRIALEFMAFGPLGDLASAVRVCAAVGWERCGLLLDSWHLMHARTPWEEVAALAPEQIALVHVADAQRLAGDADEFHSLSRFGRLPPGEGRLDFKPFREALAATGYDGVIAPEVLGFGARFDDPVTCAMRLRRSVDAFGAV